MRNTYPAIYGELHRIYQKHRQEHRENPDSQQMCCMWSTKDPPEEIEGTDPFTDIEEAWDLSIDEDEALELYDLDLDEAAQRILEMIARQHPE